MKILGIDTSSMAASVAVVEDDNLICEFTVNNKNSFTKAYANDRKYVGYE